ncbi:NAD(P)/FAD-dependent oxidoreductase [Rhodococcus sp. KBS0724]|uniref:NAD(P)/FAD-dependent oxidoreductase n=1 Tax=Rhodococcus sp. KBS0724 TaxID=1179674 RepID=UPI0021B13B4F|nr:FAD-dependent oxidoreductase [Rhodococcus sp. KBS0724]
MNSSHPGTLIVGASQAGVQLASSLRAEGYAHPIRIVGAELQDPYHRPPLSKAFLAGEVSVADLMLRNREFYSENTIDLVLGERVVEIDMNGDGSGSVGTRLGARYEFEQLVLSTGARPRRLAIPGADSGARGVLYLRDVEHALHVREQLARAQHVVVIGGGFVGLEAAATAQAMGKDVTVVEVGRQLMGRALGPHTSAFLLDAHRAAGISVLLETVPTEILVSTSNDVIGVMLGSGQRLPADLVLIGVGVLPRDELGTAIGLDCDNGILVDEHCLASDGSTIAIGDCANQPNPMTRQGLSDRIRLESVDNAVEQATVAARTIAGKPSSLRGIPWFWSDQGKYKLQIAGLIEGYDQTVTRTDPARPHRLTSLYFRERTLIAAECVNSPADFLTLKSALGSRMELSPDDLSDIDVPIKKLVASAGSRVG